MPTTDPGPATTEGLDLLSEWATWMRAAGWTPKTVSGRLGVIRCASNATGSDPLAFEPGVVSEWLAGLSNANTRSTYFRGLVAWHGWLLEQGHRPDDPTRLLRRPRQPKGVPHPVSTAGLQRLLKHLETRPRHRAMVLLCAYQGLRVHEVAKIRGEDIDLDDNVLRVLGKGGKDAVLPLHPEVVGLAAVMPRRGWWFGSSKHKGRPVAPTAVTTGVGNAMRAAGVQGSAHSLRHWYGTHLLRSGADIRVVQGLMRHASLATTEGYLEVADGAQLAAVLRLPAARDATAANAAVPAGVVSNTAPDWLDDRRGSRRVPTAEERAALGCPAWCSSGHGIWSMDLFGDDEGPEPEHGHDLDHGVSLCVEDGLTAVFVMADEFEALTPAQARQMAAELLNAADIADADNAASTG